jgi:hypothetical protein
MAAVSLALAVIALSQAGTSSVAASHGDVCDASGPAGWSCAPLVDLVDSGPGATSPAHGEILYHSVDSDTLWVVVRASHPGDRISSNGQMCLDDDVDPFTDASTGNGNKPHDCSGGNVGGGTVVDGSDGIADASPGEPDGIEQYETRVVNISTDGMSGGMDYAEFNNIDGFTNFVYRVNIGNERTQAFFTLSAATTATPSPTPEPTSGPTPDSTGDPTPAPTPAPTSEPAPEPTPEPTPIPTDAATPERTPEQSDPTPTPEASPTTTPMAAPETQPEGGEPPLIVELAQFVSAAGEPGSRDETEARRDEAQAPAATPAPIIVHLPFDAPSAVVAEQAPAASSHSASVLFFGAMALAWAGTAGVVWAGFKAGAKLDETDFPL